MHDTNEAVAPFKVREMVFSQAVARLALLTPKRRPVPATTAFKGWRGPYYCCVDLLLWALVIPWFVGHYVCCRPHIMALCVTCAAAVLNPPDARHFIHG